MAVGPSISMLIGYARTSTLEQEAGLQGQKRDLQEAAGIERIFRKQTSATGPERPMQRPSTSRGRRCPSGNRRVIRPGWMPLSNKVGLGNPLASKEEQAATRPRRARAQSLRAALARP